MATEKTLADLVINRVPTKEIMDYIVSQGLVVEDELYLLMEETDGIPTASSEVLGGVKVGSQLSINSDGVLSVNIPDASSSQNGLMTSTQAGKLNGIDENANNYTHPSYTSRTSGLYKITVDNKGHVSNVTAVSKSDITGLGIPAQDTTYSDATTNAHGLMSVSDKTKLEGIEDGANKYSHPSYTAKASGFYKVTVDSTGHVSAVTTVAKTDITGLGIPSSLSDITGTLSVAKGGTGATTAEQARANIGAGTSNFSGDYNDLNNKPNNATTSTAGLMSAEDKTLLSNMTKVVYATCDSVATAQQKELVLSNSNLTLVDGDLIVIHFSATNTFSSTADNKITFKIGTDIYTPYSDRNDAYSTGTNTTMYGYVNRSTYYFVDVTNKKFILAGHSWDNNTTYTPQSLGFGYGTCATAASTVAKVATLSSYALVTNGIVAIKFTYDVPANATLNINSKGAKPMYYKGVAIPDDVIKADNIATFIYNGSQYHLISLDTGTGGGSESILYEVSQAVEVTSGYLCLGRFQVNNSQIKIEISSTTSDAYEGTVIIATQNKLVTKAVVSGDYSNVVASRIFIVPSTSATNYVEVYYATLAGSKNLIHITPSGLVSQPTKICEATSSIPSTATLYPTNITTGNIIYTDAEPITMSYNMTWVGSFNGEETTTYSPAEYRLAFELGEEQGSN